MTDWSEHERDDLELGERRWPLAPTGLLPRERWRWWQQLWSDVLILGNRYRIRPGKDWWEDATQVEALAVFAAWAARYDSGEWDDPPGKLSLLYDVERVPGIIRGAELFHPDRYRAGFTRFLIDSGCQPATRWPARRPSPPAMNAAATTRWRDAGRAAQYLITATSEGDHHA